MNFRNKNIIMNYNEVLEKMNWSWKCPFCDIEKDLKIYNYASAYMTIAMSPYWPDHLLVIPKRHVETIFDLTIEEHDEMQWLLRAWMKMLKKLWHKDLSILVREWKESWKSVKHLHYHIIPDVLIRSTDPNFLDRKFLSEDEWKGVIEKMNSVKI